MSRSARSTKNCVSDTQFELMDIQEKTGTTFVIVTHDQEEAMTVASRVAVMDEGEIIQVATPADIYERPNSVYVADFIGDVNILNGHATRAGDGYDIAYAEGKAPLHAPSDASLAKARNVHWPSAQKKFRSLRQSPQS